MKAVQNDVTGLWVSKLSPFEYDSEDHQLALDDTEADILAYELTNGTSQFQGDPEHPVPEQPHSSHPIGRPNDR